MAAQQDIMVGLFTGDMSMRHDWKFVVLHSHC